MFNERIVCTYLYSITKYGYPPKADDTIKYMNEMTSLGFKSIELEGIREQHLSVVYNMKNEISEKLKNENINLPFFCAVLPSLTSFDSSEQNKQFELLEKGCEAAKLFGSKGLLDNAPLPPYEFPDDIPITRHYDEDILSSVSLPKNMDWKYIWDHIVETFQNVCDIAAKYDLTYQLHPAVGVLSSTTDGFLHLFDAVKRDNLRFNLDTANQFVMKENLNLALRRLAEHIDYIHISDNGGLKVEHLAIGDGIISWDSFFETLDIINYKGYLGLDIGGSESDVNDLDEAYINAAKFIEKKI